MPRLLIEDKHTYNTFPQRNLETVFTRAGNTALISFNPVVNTLLYPIQGASSEQRIGNKISTTSIVSEGFIYFDNTLNADFISINNRSYVSFYRAFYGDETTEFPGYEERRATSLPVYNTLQDKWNISIRHMVIEFDSPNYVPPNQTEINYFNDWFTNLVIQESTNRNPSNAMQVLRESTPYTGKFNILWDRTHHLTSSNPSIHYSYTIPYKRKLNFDAAGAVAPTEKFIVELFIPPNDYKIDFGSLDFGNYLYDYTTGIYQSSSVTVLSINSGFINSTLKLKYQDI